jgi:hypothetical protein
MIICPPPGARSRATAGWSLPTLRRLRGTDPRRAAMAQRLAVTADPVTRASDLLREHLAGVGCDPLAVQITARLREPMARDDDLDELASQLPGCHATPWPGSC